MARVLGVDPGTKTFDLVLLDNGEVIWEKSIPTEQVAAKPEMFIEAILEKKNEIDHIAAPSGYGTPIVCNTDIKDPLLFATEVLLLSRKEKLFGPNADKDPGSHVYRALALTVKSLWEHRLNACYIPAVIHLPTVPSYKKYNKIDMGTADKMAATFLGIVTSAFANSWNPEDVDIIYVEMGYGYNAVVKVKSGMIIDGHGGTVVPTGFLTIGGVDAEVVSLSPCWSRTYNYVGGISTACGTYDVDEALRKRRVDKKCRAAFESMLSSIEKNVLSMLEDGYKPKEIIISGRLTRYQEIYADVKKRLTHIAPIVKARLLDGAVFSKEAAQGYALVLEGIIGGRFKAFTETARLREAKGTSLSWVVHPALEEWRKRVEDVYRRALTKEAYERIVVDDIW